MSRLGERTVATLLITVFMTSMMAFVVPVSAATLTVGPGGPPTYDYATIQAAIVAANPDDTINVAAGTYVETVRVYKRIILKGEPGAIIKPDGSTWKFQGLRRAGILIDYETDGVTIEGFEIDGTDIYSIGPFYGIFSRSDDTIVRNNLVHDIGSFGDGAAGVGIMAFGWDQGIEGAIIEGNTVHDTGRMGIIVCAMRGTPFAWLVCSDIDIIDNTVYNAWQDPAGDYGGAVQINVAKDSLIQGNKIHHTESNQYGIYIAGSISVDIKENEIHDNQIGIKIWSDAYWIDYGVDDPGAPEVHYNNIYDNTEYGLLVVDEYPDFRVDATLNWWGDSRGPSRAMGKAKGHDEVKGDRVSSNVRFAPWLKQAV